MIRHFRARARYPVFWLELTLYGLCLAGLLSIFFLAIGEKS